MTIIGHTFSALVKSAVLGVALCAVSAPAMADGFFFGYRHSPPHRYHHRHFVHAHRYVWGPRVVFVAPPPVVFRPVPPPVVYRPVPPVVVTPPPAPPLAVDPAGAPYRTADGRYCREYQTTITVEGHPQPSYGTACRMPDGTWHIVN